MSELYFDENFMPFIASAGDTLPEAYHYALKGLEEHGNIYDCADWNTTQKEISLTMRVRHPLKEPRISKLFIGGPKELEQYRMEMLDGILDFEVEKGNWEYTYHQRMGNQIQFVIDELKRNPSSRRAVICIRTPDDIGSDDPACMQHLQFFIRDGKLNCHVLFRSNDACKASFMNAFALICLQERIAEELGVPVGYYQHTANSYHCYEKDLDMLKGYVNRIMEAEDIYDIAYDYDGDWKEQMEECRPEILKQVETLRNQ